MKSSEIIYLSIAVVGLLSLHFFSRRGQMPLLPPILVLLASAILGQLVWEGGRWQMIPIYVLAVGFLALAALIWILDRQPIPPIALPVGWVMVLATGALGVTYPIAEFPFPTGPFAVGTVVRHLVDVSRPETLGPDVNRHRELMIQIWYPADPAYKGTDAQYVMSAAQVDAFNNSQFLKLDTHALLEAPISDARAHYPVLIYSPSWHGQRYQNTVLFEELASHGFVVVSIDHPYGSAVTAFPDGRVARAKPAEFWDVSSDNALKRSIQYIEMQLAVRVKDVEFVADELRRYNWPRSHDEFSDRLDLNRLGVFGYSFGGAVAVQTCWQDHRFRAVVDLDGALFGDSARFGIEQPLLVMTDNEPPPSGAELTSSRAPHKRYAALINEQIQLLHRDMLNHGGYLLKIDGADHYSYSDNLMVTPVGWIRNYYMGLGRLRAMKIVNVYTLAFFEHFLNGENQPLLNGSSPQFPLVTLEISSPRHERQ